jgi:hypothetical protein
VASNWERHISTGGRSEREVACAGHTAPTSTVAYRGRAWIANNRAFVKRRVAGWGAEPKCTLRRTARSANLTHHETPRFAVTRPGRRRRRTRGHWTDACVTGKSPTEISTLPGGTEGLPSWLAASAGNRKLPARSHAAGRPATTPGPTELNQPLAAGMHKRGPHASLPVVRPAAGRAEPASTVPSMPTTAKTAIGLVIAPGLRSRRAFRSAPLREPCLPKLNQTGPPERRTPYSHSV